MSADHSVADLRKFYRVAYSINTLTVYYNINGEAALNIINLIKNVNDI